MQLLTQGNKILSYYDDHIQLNPNIPNGEVILYTDLSPPALSIQDPAAGPLRFNDLDKIFTVNQIKAMKIDAMNNYVANQISAQYPATQQTAIMLQIGYSQTDLDNMKAYMTGMHTSAATKQSALDALSSIDDVIAFNIYQ